MMKLAKLCRYWLDVSPQRLRRHKIWFSNGLVEYALAEISVIVTPQDFAKNNK